MATASAAFGVLKKGFAVGRDIESMASDLSRWMGALSDLDMLEKEAMIKKELMNHEFAINMRLKQAELQVVNSKEAEKEDRKDERTRIQASQQSELIDQRNNNKPPKKFESMGNDSLGDLGNLGMYDPR